MNYLETYESLYHKSPDGEVFCPYRISPLGAHIDHQYGKIHGLAIDKGIHIAYSAKKTGVIELCSLNFPKRAQFHIRSIEPETLAAMASWPLRVAGAASTIMSEKAILDWLVDDLAADPEIDEFIVVTNHKFAEHFVRWGETKAQKGHLAVPPFYFYRREDVKRIPEALAAGCGADAPGSFAAWLSRQVPMHAFVMPGKRYDVGDVESYRRVCWVFEGK